MAETTVRANPNIDESIRGGKPGGDGDLREKLLDILHEKLDPAITDLGFDLSTEIVTAVDLMMDEIVKAGHLDPD